MNLSKDGYCIFDKKISPEWVEKLKAASLNAIEAHKEVQLQEHGIVTINGAAINSLVSDNVFVEFISELFEIGIIDFIERKFFKSKFILNSFSSLNNIANEPNFAANIHRDIKFYSGNVPIMLNAILMLDEFTERNGATLILPRSHKKKYKPSIDQFNDYSIKALGGAGTIFLFNSNLWHSSSPNMTDTGRVAIAMTFSKSSIKQLFDYPRALGERGLRPEIKQLLGYYSVVPATLNEWYSPNRTYQKNQD